VTLNASPRSTPKTAGGRIAETLQGGPAATAVPQRKWARELEYRLIKELWALHQNRIAMRFNTNGTTIPAIGTVNGNEQREFDAEA
jgi:nuclear transport factor 2 (NTF2) superfamily protein